MDRVSICAPNLAGKKGEPFLDRLVTGDEKWIAWKNVERKRAYMYREPASILNAGVYQKIVYSVVGGTSKEYPITSYRKKLKLLVLIVIVPVLSF